jgi:hypothetical protein
MNIRPAAGRWRTTLVIFAMAAGFITGCQTIRPIDWNNRVGTYTYDQAVTELGPPDKQAALSDGKIVASWITHRYGGTSFSVGTGFYGDNTGFGVGQTIGTGYPAQVLTLTFGTNYMLAAWSKNY